MTDREADLYRWFETRTLGPDEFPIDPEDEQGQFAKLRRYVKRKPGNLFELTEGGFDWFAVRSTQIVARCNAGLHHWRTRTPYCVGKHCLWCGEADSAGCTECVKFYLSGTIEGGWKTPLTPSFEQNPRSTIKHGDKRP